MTDVDITSLLQNFANDIKGELKKDIRANADISIKNHEETRRELGGLRTELHEVKSTVNILWKKVMSPNVPPPKSSGEYRQVDAKLAKEKPLVQSVSDHNLDLSSLKSQVITLNDKFDSLSGIAHEVLAMNREQSASLGIGVSIRKVGEFLAWAKTKEGQRYVATIFAAATSLVTALGTTYALMTKRLPTPMDPVPTVQTVYVPVPVQPIPTTSGSSHP